MVLVVMIAIGLVFAKGWSKSSSVFGFESPFWDLGLIPILIALAIIAVRAKVADRRRLRFLARIRGLRIGGRRRLLCLMLSACAMESRVGAPSIPDWVHAVP